MNLTMGLVVGKVNKDNSLRNAQYYEAKIEALKWATTELTNWATRARKAKRAVHPDMNTALEEEAHIYECAAEHIQVEIARLEGEKAAIDAAGEKGRLQ